jgi:hypothetical protein
MKKRLLLAIAVLLSVVAEAQIKWPAITQTTKPWTRWWWMGSAVNEKDLTANMEQYQAAGLGGLEITPIYGVMGYEKQFIDFLSPQWMQLLDHTLAEAKRLNLGIDMATGTGWPFGGGPLIDTEDACKDFVYKTWSLKEGEQLKDTIYYIQEPFVRAVGPVPDINTIKDPIYTNTNLQALALDQVKFRKPLSLQTLMAYNSNGQVVDLTSKVNAAGKLDWTAPAGAWTLYGLFMGWHGKMVERAAPGGEGHVIDHFALAPLQKYFSRFDSAFTGHTLHNMRGFFNDSYEVDDARGQSNWTPALFEEFAKRRGYDLRQHLPALLEKNPNENSLRILYDYRQTIADLLLEKFTTPWHDWAKAKGKIVRNQSHGSPANILDLYGAVDIPETEGTDILRFKFAPSAAHVLGKPLASAEAATWLNEHFKSSLGDVKRAVDNYFIGGVNHLVYHGTNYSPANETWPGWLFYAAVHFHPNNPFWKDFGTLNNYVTRCQSFLQAGKPDNDVLLYFPFSDRNSLAPTTRGLLHHYDGMEGFENTDFKTVAEHMLANGYAFDLISDKQLQLVTNNGASLKTPGGTYKTIVLANTKYLPLETMQKLQALAAGGATILVYKQLPSGVPGFGDLEKKQQTFNGIVTALEKTGRLKVSDDLLELLAQQKVPRESMVAQGLQCIRRQVSGGKYYFIANTGQQPVTDWVALSTKAAGVILFDPMREQNGLAKTRVVDGLTEVYLSLMPGESCVLQTTTTAVKGSSFPYYTPGGDVIPVKGAWQIQFVRGGPALPAASTMDSLDSWTELPGEEVKRFSGTAQYTIHFTKPVAAVSAKAFLLDLGNVAQSAEVWLNGKKLATLIGPVYQVTIAAGQLAADNVLTIAVTNGMANRIASLDKQGVKWKKFYNTNFPARLAANRGNGGLFTAANWLPEPSGLLGPVTLTPLVIMK